MQFETFSSHFGSRPSKTQATICRCADEFIYLHNHNHMIISYS